MIKIDYYEILELPGDADERMIKKAYYRLARELHPDKASSRDEAKILEKRFAQISAAYNILKDPRKREEYKRRHSQVNRASTSTARVLSASRGVPVGRSADPIVTSPRQKFGLTPEKISIAQKAYTRGMQCYRGNQFGKAIEFFEAAIQNNGTEPSYYARLGLTLIRARKSAARAVDLAQKAIKLDPYNISHKLDLTSIYETIGSKSNAENIYDDILRWDEENQQARSALERLGGRRKRFCLRPAFRANGGGTPTAVSGGGLLGSLMGILRR